METRTPWSLILLSSMLMIIGMVSFCRDSGSEVKPALSVEDYQAHETSYNEEESDMVIELSEDEVSEPDGKETGIWTSFWRIVSNPYSTKSSSRSET